MNKICIITGTRADYWLLRPIIMKLEKSEDLKLQLIATGAHLSNKHGLTIKDIISDGIYIDKTLDIEVDDDSALGIINIMSRAISDIGKALIDLKPDLVLILGDRYEIFMAASAATIAQIPIAHIHGGEKTIGAYDEAFRHSITKMSSIHYTSTEQYRKRVIQLGENPERVFNVGSLGVENIKSCKLLSKAELEEQINFRIDDNTLLVTFHPVTLENNTSERQFYELISAIKMLENARVIFTKSNADTNSSLINQMIDNFVEDNPQTAKQFTSLGQLRYLSAMKYVGAVVGNSSSGIIEAPSLSVPTVNIGDRQKGRIQAESVLNCEPNKIDIYNAIQKAMEIKHKEYITEMYNPYEGANPSDSIIESIRSFLDNGDASLKKDFYDISF